MTCTIYPRIRAESQLLWNIHQEELCRSELCLLVRTIRIECYLQVIKRNLGKLVIYRNSSSEITTCTCQSTLTKHRNIGSNLCCLARAISQSILSILLYSLESCNVGYTCELTCRCINSYQYLVISCQRSCHNLCGSTIS